MSPHISNRRTHKSRELRRRVLLPARMRTCAGWSDACILNISSRGLLIQSAHAFSQGSVIELRHRDHVIVGRVVWRDGAKAGLQADERLPVEQILSLADSPVLSLTAGSPGPVERRKIPRTHEQSRVQSRMLEFVGVAIIAAMLSIGAFVMVGEALAHPLAKVRLALGAG
jgi:hypothetical protein